MMKNWAKKEQLWKLVDKHKEDLLSICSELIQIPSAEWKGIEEILRYCCAFFDRLGISYQVLRPCGEIPCIVAQFGKDTKEFGIMNGHLDTAPAGDLSRWRYEPFDGTITDSRILGRGASDMKCGCAILLFLLKLMTEEHLMLEGKLFIHLVCDEEQGGEQGSKWLTENGYADGAKFCIVPGPTSYDYLEIGQKGSAGVLLRTYGKAVNSSRINYAGESAAHKMIKILFHIQELSGIEGSVTQDEQEIIRTSQRMLNDVTNRLEAGETVNHINVHILSINGGKGLAMTSEICEACLALGVPFMISREQVEEKLRQIIKDSGEERCDIEFLHWQDGARTPAEDPLVLSVKRNAEKITGRQIVPAYQWATSDVKYYRSRKIPTIQFGPANNKGIQSYNEDVEISDIISCAKTHLAVLDDLLGIIYPRAK